MEKIDDVPLIHPLVKRINKEHVWKTQDAMHVCGVGDHVLPRNFYHRNAYDQRHYFERVLDLKYCTTCRCPMLPEAMRTDYTCVACALTRDENWEQVRIRRQDKLVGLGARTRYQERAKRRMQNAAFLQNFISANQVAVAKKAANVAASNGEAPTYKPTPEPTHDSAWDILERADRREPRKED